MTSQTDNGKGHAEGEKVQEQSLDSVSGALPFGPVFFLEQLHAFVRDNCPGTGEHLPAVEIHLVDGEVLDVCHITGLGPHWVALAVYDGEQAAGQPTLMRTDLVPYEIIGRITIRTTRKRTAQLGFEPNLKPAVWAAAPGNSPESTQGGGGRVGLNDRGGRG